MSRATDTNRYTDDSRIIALRQELSEYSVRSFQRSLISGTGGNLSVRVPDTDMALVTPSGISLAEVEPEDNILCNLKGEVLDSPQGYKPSKETSFHLALYMMRSEAMAVVHVHPPYATAYANQRKELPLVTVSAQVKLKFVPCIKSALPGSKELRELVIKGIREYPQAVAMLMEAHGILALGPDLKSAYYLADLVEDTAKIAFISANIADKS